MSSNWKARRQQVQFVRSDLRRANTEQPLFLSPCHFETLRSAVDHINDLRVRQNYAKR
jgi:hypothetical protein